MKEDLVLCAEEAKRTNINILMIWKPFSLIFFYCKGWFSNLSHDLTSHILNLFVASSFVLLSPQVACSLIQSVSLPSPGILRLNFYFRSGHYQGFNFRKSAKCVLVRGARPCEWQTSQIPFHRPLRKQNVACL